jgi:hypothetical protein
MSLKMKPWTGPATPRTGTALWIALLAALSIGGSLAFACAAPLAAIAALAGAKMDRTPGLILVSLAWLSNQIVGYAWLGYPQTLDAFAWGAAIGVASVAAFLVSRAVVSPQRSKPVWLAASFLAAFGIYELALFLAGIPLGASAEEFSFGVIGRVFEVNVISFGGLLALSWLAGHLGHFMISAPQASRA